jgi:hypothetical protein
LQKTRIDAQGFTPDEVKARYFVALLATLEIHRMPEAWPTRTNLKCASGGIPLNLSMRDREDLLVVENTWIKPVGAPKTDLPVAHLPLFNDNAPLAIDKANVDHRGDAFVIAKQVLKLH